MPERAAAPEGATWAPVLMREPPPPGGGEIVSVDDVNARHVDEWVIMRVTAYDTDRWPSEGYVIAHDLSENRCWDAYRQAEAAGEPREAMHYIFIAGPMVKTGAEMMAAIERLQEEWVEDADPVSEPRA